jgi:hypothetical protein
VELCEIRGCRRGDDADRYSVEETGNEEGLQTLRRQEDDRADDRDTERREQETRRPYRSERCPARSSATITPIAYIANATVTMNSEKWSRARYRP